MSKFLGNVLALALEKTRTPTGYDFQRAAEVVANAARLDRKRRGYLKRRRHQARMMLASEDRRTREIIDAVSDRHGLLPGDVRVPPARMPPRSLHPNPPPWSRWRGRRTPNRPPTPSATRASGPPRDSRGRPWRDAVKSPDEEVHAWDGTG